MDRKSIPIILVIFALMLLLPKLVNKWLPPVPVPVSTNEVVSATGVTASGTNLPVMTTGSPGSTKFVVDTTAPEQVLTTSNADVRWTITSRGGGVQQAELFGYPQTPSVVRRTNQVTNGIVILNSPVVPPVLSVLGEGLLQGDGVYKLSPITNGVRAEKALPNGLVIIKDFQPASNYLLAVTVRVKNTSAQAMTLPPQAWSAGTAIPMSPQDNGSADYVMWYNGSKSGSLPQTYFRTNTSTLGIFPRTPLTEYHVDNTNIYWVSAQNQFFALATMPDTNRLPTGVGIRMVFLPPPSQEEIDASSRTVKQPQGMEASIEYPGGQLMPGQESTLHFTIFAGPKIYRTLSDLSDQMGNHIDSIMGFGFWGPISRALLAAMNGLHNQLHFPYGLAIIFITLVIRLAIWPLTRASTRSMKRMQELQPQIKALQEKYKDDPQKFQQKSWEFYRKNKVNPLGSCLPMLLQIPVFIGFFGMLRNAIELRGAHFLWIRDLSLPDTVYVLSFLGHNLPINPMPLIMGASQFWQASMTPVSPGMDPAQQKMMRYIPLLMVYFFYNYAAGLALYWTVSNLMTIFQNKVTKTQPVTATAVPAATPAAVRRK